MLGKKWESTKHYGILCFSFEDDYCWSFHCLSLTEPFLLSQGIFWKWYISHSIGLRSVTKKHDWLYIFGFYTNFEKKCQVIF